MKAQIVYSICIDISPEACIINILHGCGSNGLSKADQNQADHDGFNCLVD